MPVGQPVGAGRQRHAGRPVLSFHPPERDASEDADVCRCGFVDCRRDVGEQGLGEGVRLVVTALITDRDHQQPPRSNRPLVGRAEHPVHPRRHVRDHGLGLGRTPRRLEVVRQLVARVQRPRVRPARPPLSAARRPPPSAAWPARPDPPLSATAQAPRRTRASTSGRPAKRSPIRSSAAASTCVTVVLKVPPAAGSPAESSSSKKSLTASAGFGGLGRLAGRPLRRGCRQPRPVPLGDDAPGRVADDAREQQGDRNARRHAPPVPRRPPPQQVACRRRTRQDRPALQPATQVVGQRRHRRVPPCRLVFDLPWRRSRRGRGRATNRATAAAGRAWWRSAAAPPTRRPTGRAGARRAAAA